MKKLSIILLVIVGLSNSSFAQTKGDVEFGVNIGYNTSNVSDDNNSSDSGNGVNIGFAADYFFSNRWSIKGKFIYDQKGWNNGIIIVGPDSYKTDYNLNYITIPVMANWHFAKKRNWYLNFGPYVGFLVNAKETKFETDVKDAFNTTDFGLSIGVGVKIPVSDKLKVSLEYEAQSGASEIFKDNNGSKVTNGRGSFNVGLNFMLDKPAKK